LVLQQCGSCSTKTLEVSSTTQFFVGASPISLADLKALVADGHAHFAMVFTALSQPQVLRVVVSE
jgi:hypothetical protein